MTIRGPNWRRRWGKFGAARKKAQANERPAPKLFKRLDERLFDNRNERKARGKRNKGKPRSEGLILTAIENRRNFAEIQRLISASVLPLTRVADAETIFRNDPAIVAFVGVRDRAVKLYAALCNVEWIDPNGREPAISVSWRAAGRIVAELRSNGEDYIDFYCSGGEGVVSLDVALLMAGVGKIAVGAVNEFTAHEKMLIETKLAERRDAERWKNKE